MRAAVEKNIIRFIAEKLLVEQLINPKVTDAEICERVGLSPSRVANYKSRYRDFWLTQQREMRGLLKNGLVESMQSTVAELRAHHEADSRGLKCIIAAALLEGQAKLYLENFWDVEKRHEIRRE